MTGPNVVVECPGDLAALIVQLHKETPDGRLFLAGFTAAGSVVTGTAHLGMTNPTDPAHLVRETTKLIGVLRRAEWGDTAMAALVAFGTTLVADPYLDLASGLVTHMAALPLVDVIRVCDGRYWSYTGDAPAEYARDSEGEEFDPLTDRAIEAATTIARAELGEPQ